MLIVQILKHISFKIILFLTLCFLYSTLAISDILTNFKEYVN